MGAEACKDEVFVLALEMAFSLSRLERCANEPRSHRPDSYMKLHSSLLLVFQEDPKESENWTNKIWLEKKDVEVKKKDVVLSMMW